jgi:hypothetical protein
MLRLRVSVVIALALISTDRAADRATTIVGADLADGSGAALRTANVRASVHLARGQEAHQALKPSDTAALFP